MSPILLAASALAIAAPPDLSVGRPFPDITLPTLTGEMRRISDYRGRKIVLHVFASW